MNEKKSEKSRSTEVNKGKSKNKTKKEHAKRNINVSDAEMNRIEQDTKRLKRIFKDDSPTHELTDCWFSSS